MSAVLGTYARIDVAFERGEGAYLFTAAGERYLDFAAGVAVNILGHAHPHLVAAVTEQAAKVWHTSNLYRIAGQERLAERLASVTFADKVFFANSGAEAMEASIKMARKYHSQRDNPERYRILTFEGAFHGRTLATIAAGNQPKHLAGFGPKVDGFDQVPLGDLAAARAAITKETAGILIEPVQGEGGIRSAGWDFLRAFCSSSTRCNAAWAGQASSLRMSGRGSNLTSWRSPKGSAAASRSGPASQPRRLPPA